MRNLTSLLVTLYIGAVSPALASDPPGAPAPAPTSQTSGATPAAAPAPAAEAASPTAESKPSAAATPPASDAAGDNAKAAADLDKQTKRLRSQGYKPKVAKDGTTYFCRNESQVGSRFPTERCGTAADLDRAALYGKDTTEDMQRKGNMTPRSN
jgi:hypothetical protein